MPARARRSASSAPSQIGRHRTDQQSAQHRQFTVPAPRGPVGHQRERNRVRNVDRDQALGGQVGYRYSSATTPITPAPTDVSVTITPITRADRHGGSGRTRFATSRRALSGLRSEAAARVGSGSGTKGPRRSATGRSGAPGARTLRTGPLRVPALQCRDRPSAAGTDPSVSHPVIDH